MTATRSLAEAVLQRRDARPGVQAQVTAVRGASLSLVEACTVSGAADAVVHMLARDIPHMEQAIQRVRATAPVERTESAIVLSRLLNRPRL